MNTENNVKNELTTNDKNIISNIVLKGDISGLKPDEKVKYYNMFCESLGLNPVTKPFQIIKFQNKEVLYATKDATEQLRKLNGVSVIEMDNEKKNDILIVKTKVQDKQGRTDISTGAVNIKNLYGDALANAIMKAETKSKRRATLSICGLGILDETEIETLPGKTEMKNVTPQPDPIGSDKEIIIDEIDRINSLQSLENFKTIAHNQVKDFLNSGEMNMGDVDEINKAFKNKEFHLSKKEAS